MPEGNMPQLMSQDEIAAQGIPEAADHHPAQVTVRAPAGQRHGFRQTQEEIPVLLAAAAGGDGILPVHDRRPGQPEQQPLR